MNWLRYFDGVLTNLTRVRTTGTFFSWLDVPTYSDAERSEAAPTPARRRTVPPEHDRDACD